jgi:integrase
MRSNRASVYERTAGAGDWYIRYSDMQHKIRRERATWAKLKEAGIEVKGSTKLEQPGRDLATKLLDARRSACDRKEKQAALHVRRLCYGQLREGLIASYQEKGNRTLYKTRDDKETIGGLKALDQFFGFSAGNPGPPVSDITTDSARAFARKQLAAGYSRATINRSLACLRRMLAIAREDGKLQSVPVIRLQKEPPARKGFVTQKQFDELLRALPTNLRPLVQFLYWCGCRKGEACAIEWPQVSLEERLIRLEADQTKNGTVRTIPLPSVVAEELSRIEPKTGKVFDDSNLRTEWARACTTVGLGKMEELESEEGNKWQRYSGLIVHDLRRSAIRNMVAAGNPENWCMAISGHKTASVFRRYAIVSTADITTAMRRVESARLSAANPSGTNTDTKLLEAEQVKIDISEPVTVQ